ncbi:leucyl aminopeptidase [Methylobacterium terrae]|uniref:Leucyl aminopeptidase n=1 Tax=Methylobacterium terrae TaxID=2202827 RepID=A0A2U8WQZ4_9HYPH|nr:leucyl aminopeptidase family protein [Methylobacterium terrae]AWN47716.1 leucyl aminopeptidase [Methylobacterium terrae]
MPRVTTLLPATEGAAIPIRCVAPETWPRIAEALPPLAAAFAASSGFEAKPGRVALLPGPDGALSAVLVGVETGERADPFALGRLAESLPEGTYRLEGLPGDPALAALAWLLSGYRFGRYRERPAPKARLVAPDGVDAAEIERIAGAVAAGRDLVNTPANDLGPAEIEAAARSLAERFGAACTVVAGDALERGFPLVAAVGRASPRAPRLIDIAWGDEGAPRVTLVGKGVVFDTGGLDLKPAAAMLMMKKDMAGAAVALAAAEMVMGAGLPLRLRVLIPTVENAVAGEAFRPGDVLASRQGLTVEIGNTDAEGRLILADALALADEEAPELVFDFATLTGAARVALGPDLPALFTEDDALAADLAATGLAVNDPVWRMPLWAPYGSLLDSKVADLNNVSSGPFAGAVTAALFLRRFARSAKAHVHLDLYGWNPGTKPGRPEGGEVQTARLVYALLKRRYPAPRA